MAKALRDFVAYILAHYLVLPLEKKELGMLARLSALEEAQFTYLPDSKWLLQVGYTSTNLGTYELIRYVELEPFYKIEVLSQTSMILLFCGDRFIAGRQVKNDAQLLSFLKEYSFPAPSCE